MRISKKKPCCIISGSCFTLITLYFPLLVPEISSSLKSVTDDALPKVDKPPKIKPPEYPFPGTSSASEIAANISGEFSSISVQCIPMIEDDLRCHSKEHLNSKFIIESQKKKKKHDSL